MPLRIPDNFVCPITSKVMLDPCTAACSHDFEKDAIFGWLQISQDFCCPICSTSFINQIPMRNDLLRANIQRFFISNPQAIGLVEASIRVATHKQSLLYGYINGKQSIAPSRMHLDVNINAEWVSVLSSCLERSYALEMAPLDSQDLEQYVAYGFMPQYITQRSNNTSYQFASFASLNYGGDANISIFLRQAREWYRTAMAIESSGSHSERKASNKLKFCCVS